jgi:heme/copper-type cytochrome/quinol oxidase subunit 2
MLAAFADLLAQTEKSASEEGRDIVLSMLVVGLIFIAVIAIGQFFKWLGHRQH